MHYGASVSEVADSTAARSQSLNPPYLLSTATQTRSRGVQYIADSVANVGESVGYLGVNMDVACQEGRVPRLSEHSLRYYLCFYHAFVYDQIRIIINTRP